MSISSIGRAALALAVVPAVLGAQAPRPATAPAAMPRDPYLARVHALLRTTPLVDGHNDLPWRIREDSVHPRDVEAYDIRKTVAGHTDLPRLEAGRVGVQFWSVYIPGERGDENYTAGGHATAGTPGYARVQLEQFAIAHRVLEKYADRLAFARTSADARRAFAAGKIGSFLGMEGGHAIENSLGALRAFHDLGARYMTLTHNVTLDWADAAAEAPRHGGLTPFGEEVVREMNRLGMLVDLSHVSPGTMSDALRISEAPVIFSHSSARAIVDHSRNVPDSILAQLPRNGGVVMVTFVPGFDSRAVFAHDRLIRDSLPAVQARHAGDRVAAERAVAEWRVAHPRPQATMADVIEHIEHVRKVAGIDHVAIGGDFDGIGETPVGLEDVSSYPRLLAELARRGWTDADLRKLAGANTMRVVGAAERVSARLRTERAPSVRTIAELDGANSGAASPRAPR